MRPEELLEEEHDQLPHDCDTSDVESSEVKEHDCMALSVEIQHFLNHTQEEHPAQDVSSWSPGDFLNQDSDQEEVQAHYLSVQCAPTSNNSSNQGAYRGHLHFENNADASIEVTDFAEASVSYESSTCPGRDKKASPKQPQTSTDRKFGISITNTADSRLSSSRKRLHKECSAASTNLVEQQSGQGVSAGAMMVEEAESRRAMEVEEHTPGQQVKGWSKWSEIEEKALLDTIKEHDTHLHRKGHPVGKSRRRKKNWDWIIAEIESVLAQEGTDFTRGKKQCQDHYNDLKKRAKDTGCISWEQLQIPFATVNVTGSHVTTSTVRVAGDSVIGDPIPLPADLDPASVCSVDSDASGRPLNLEEIFSPGPASRSGCSESADPFDGHERDPLLVSLLSSSHGQSESESMALSRQLSFGD